MNQLSNVTTQYSNQIRNADAISLYINLDFTYKPTLLELISFLNSTQDGKTNLKLMLISRGTKDHIGLNKKTIFLDVAVIGKIKNLFPKALILLTFENNNKTKKNVEKEDIQALKNYISLLKNDA